MTLSRFIFACAFAGSISAAGCAHRKNDPTTQPIADREKLPVLHTQWDETPLKIEQKPVAVVEGPTPLMHIFDIGGPIRVLDLTSDVVLATTTVPDRTLVRLDDRHGVTVGMDNISPGPLPAGHRFGIFVDPTTENVIRRGRDAPLRIDR